MNNKELLTVCISSIISITLCLVFFVWAVTVNAEVVTWKPKGEITVSACMTESKQEENICKKIVEMWQSSEKYDILETYTIYTEEK